MQWTGPLVAGVLADSLGVESAVLVLAAAMAVLALTLHLGRRHLALLDIPLEEIRELPVSDAEPGETAADGAVLTRSSKDRTG